MSVSPKHIVLLLLVFQTTAHVTLLGYSRSILQEPYISSTVIFLSEALKTLFACVMFAREKSDATFTDLVTTALPVSIPAFLYFVNNWLSFIALSNLTPMIFSILAQMKLLTTAVFSVVLLRRSLSANKWRALLILTTGCVLVNLRVNDSDKNDSMLGVFCMILYAVFSGLAGVYFEKVLKNSGGSIWQRNIQLGAFSMITSVAWMLCTDYDKLAVNGFFHGYSVVTAGIVCMYALSGMLVALVIKYADNILKGFATALAIIVTTLLNWALFGLQPTAVGVFGSVNVITSIFMFGDKTCECQSKATAALTEPLIVRAEEGEMDEEIL